MSAEMPFGVLLANIKSGYVPRCCYGTALGKLLAHVLVLVPAKQNWLVLESNRGCGKSVRQLSCPEPVSTVCWSFSWLPGV